MVNKGLVLVLRNVLPSFKIVGQNLACQDTNGKLMRIGLYNYDKSVPVGAILGIRDPHYKRSNDGYTNVRAENPSNVLLWTTSS